MRKFSKIIYCIVLFSFSFTASAGSVLCCCDISDKNDTQQNPVDTTNKKCHADQSTPPENTSVNYCQVMNSCNGTSLYIFNSPDLILHTTHQAIQLPDNEHNVLNTYAPPTRPPKLII